MTIPKRKKAKIIRPEITVEYKGFRGFVLALVAVCRIGVRRVTIDCGLCEIRYICIPKYTFKRGGEK